MLNFAGDCFGLWSRYKQEEHLLYSTTSPRNDIGDSMFGDYGKELLKSGIIDAKAGNRESARRYFDRAVYISNDHEVLAEAWFWMSQVIDDRVEKRKALENCLAQQCSTMSMVWEALCPLVMTRNFCLAALGKPRLATRRLRVNTLNALPVSARIRI
jgi:hypothetical protein